MSKILGSQQRINGYTQNSLADRWTIQTFSTPPDVNPFIIDDAHDLRGRRGSVERHDNFQLSSPKGISFLGGFFSNNPVVVTRTIVGGEDDTVYFAPFANVPVDNTTPTPYSGFTGGYAFTPQHLADLKAKGLNPRDASSVLGAPTLIDYVRNWTVRSF